MTEDAKADTEVGRHTPEPWTTGEARYRFGRGRVLHIYAEEAEPGGKLVAEVLSMNPVEDGRLMAAAPKLAAALRATGQAEAPCDNPKECGTDWGTCVPCMARDALDGIAP